MTIASSIINELYESIAEYSRILDKYSAKLKNSIDNADPPLEKEQYDKFLNLSKEAWIEARRAKGWIMDHWWDSVRSDFF